MYQFKYWILHCRIALSRENKRSIYMATLIDTSNVDGDNLSLLFP